MKLSLRQPGVLVVVLTILSGVLFVSLAISGYTQAEQTSPMAADAQVDVSYVLTPEAAKQLYGGRNLTRAFRELGVDFDGVYPSKPFNYFAAVHIPGGRPAFEACLDREIGRENWHQSHEPLFRLRNAHGYGLMAWTQWNTAEDGSFTSRTLTRGLWQSALRLPFHYERGTFELGSSTISYQGPPWILLLLLLYGPLLPIVLLRRPLTRGLQSLSRRLRPLLPSTEKAK